MLSRLRVAAPVIASASAALVAHRDDRCARLESGLSPSEWRPLTVLSIDKLSPNTSKFRFLLPDESTTAGLPVASCLLTKAPLGAEKPDGTRKPVIRPYTPTSPPHAVGYLDLVVKTYEKGVMSAHFGRLAVGDQVEMKGPIVKLPYAPNTWERVGMVAGGTGITPMLQVIDAILSNPADKTKVSLVFANVTEEDILLKPKIDALAEAHADRFDVLYVLDRPPSVWTGGAGFITAAMLSARLPPPGEKNKIFVCGPPGMMKVVSGEKVSPKDQGEVLGHLKTLGYDKDMVFKF